MDAQRTVITSLLVAFMIFVFAGDKVPTALASVKPVKRA